MTKKLKHIAIICDGNRRWAKRKGLPEFSGHKYAVETTLENLVDHAIKLKIPYLTFWLFSTENWNRGQTWTKKFFDLFRLLLPKAQNHYLKKGVKFNHIGNLKALPKDIQKAFNDWIQKSKDLKKVTVTIAFNYGGRDEILKAVNQLLKSRSDRLKGASDLRITAKEFEACLDTHDLPDPDLLIRTGEGNTRLSGFMLWQIAYTQLYFTNILFPDLTPQKLDEAINWYHTQTQNLGA